MPIKTLYDRLQLAHQVTFGERNLSQLDYPREVVAQAIEKYEEEQRALAHEQDEPSPSMDSTEVKRLQGQVKVLRGMLLGSVLALGGSIAWIWYEMKPEWTNTRQPVESITLERCIRLPAHSESASPHCPKP